jgi:AraC-like DNA-binding protein
MEDKQEDVVLGGNSLYIWDSELLFICQEDISWFLDNTFHKLHAAFIIVPLNQTSEITTEHGEQISYTGLFIPPNTKYKNQTMKAHLLALQIDPDSIYFHGISHLLDKGISTFESQKVPDLALRVKKILENGSESEAVLLKKSILKLLEEQNPAPKKHRQIDSRVLLAINYLKNLPDLTENTNLSHLSKLVGLSQDRFRHLFSENMNISLRRYILYLRIKKTAFYLSQEMNLTRAAHNSGFADLAHLSRTFREMYGNNPSSMFLKKNKIRFYFCNKQE